MFKPINKHLRRFLWNRDLYFLFLIDILLGVESVKDLIYKRNSLSVAKETNIAIAFDWDKSIEGPDYWYQVNRKWEIEYGMLLMAGIIEPNDTTS